MSASWTAASPLGPPPGTFCSMLAPADRFRGENETIDVVAGHIPGAVSAPALANVDRHARFLPADELAVASMNLAQRMGESLARIAVANRSSGSR